MFSEPRRYREENQKVLTKPISYRIAAKEDITFKIEGLVCSQWIETKRITGSFWLGSCDTEYLHTTKEVSPTDCWGMKLKLECAGNRNAVNGKTYSYVHEPTGDGKWMSIKEYSVVNCLAQEIELRRDRVGGPILSPFGSHNVSLGVDHLVVNHNTIVWIEPNKVTDGCVAKFTFTGTGQLSIIRLGLDSNNQVTKHSNRTGRLIDSTKQIEVLFDTTRNPLCNDHPNSYAVLGIPDTHIVFEENIEKVFIKQMTKLRQSRQVSRSYIPPRNAFAWGHILPLDPTYLNRGYVVSTTNREASSGRLTWKVFAGLGLKPRLPNDKDLSQEFEHATDQSLRFVKGVQYCLNIEQPNTVQVKSYSGHYTRWLYDDYRMYIMDTERRRCLTLAKEKIILLPCEMEPHSTKQMWKFENRNTESTFVQTFPNMTIEDREFGLEFQSKPSEKIRNIKSIFNWGQLMNGDKQSCLMHDSTSTTNEVVFHYCKFSNDLEFEYTTDYTVRMLQSNQCLRVNDEKAFLERITHCKYAMGFE